MNTIPAQFHLDQTPIPHPDAIVTTTGARFTILTSRLIRLEFDPDEHFEDRASQAFWYRRQPVPRFTSEEQDGVLYIHTEHLQIRYRPGSDPTDPQNFNILITELGLTWHLNLPNDQNLLGTTRTLDGEKGHTPLEQGLVSRAGWTLVDDTNSLVFENNGWLAPRQASLGYRDLYFFGHGHAYKQCLKEYTKISGPVPLIPRWILGNWWSRYWAYTQDELTNLMRDFRAHHIPLSVCIIDMDWHLVDVDPQYVGWTGYTWNKELFPDPKGFMKWLHEQGLYTALNLHPAAGVQPYEDIYPRMAEWMGVDPDSKETIPFQLSNPKFTQAYFELLHHPHEQDGVDFWWIDWQQGETSDMPGLDPLWWLNHLHFFDLGRGGQKRPFIFSRWGGLGNHRYPIGFSGDTHVTWDALDFQPYFTATAANVGYSWWSHDIGGHMMGIEDRELYTRWVQFGLFSPILRLHSTNNPFHDRRPWGYDDTVLNITRDVMQQRHAFIPYLYSLAWRNSITGEAPFRPMYHDYPDCDEAYNCPQQYTFGSNIIVAPYTAPADPDTNLSRQLVWLPPGDWHHFYTGEYHAGDRWHVCYGDLTDIPVFVRAGAIIPLAPKTSWGGLNNPELIELHVFAGGDGRFTLTEDDGQSNDYQFGAYALTNYKQTWHEDALALAITPNHIPDGDHPTWLPEKRQYQLHLHGLAPDIKVNLSIAGLHQNLNSTYDPITECHHVEPFTISSTQTGQLIIQATLSRRDRRPEHLNHMLTHFTCESMCKMAIAQHWDTIQTNPHFLLNYKMHLSQSQQRALLELICQAGIHHITNMRHKDLIILWNNNPTKLPLTYQWTKWQNEWDVTQRFQSEYGDLPSYQAITPHQPWQIELNYGDILTIKTNNE
ncbi:MAG TPA: TIM-barrel domain-containing protein [Anaerolineae bacterium]|nr:TIM-barrel domain-containing protein [Anaerolineae bacterium]